MFDVLKSSNPELFRTLKIIKIHRIATENELPEVLVQIQAGISSEKCRKSVSDYWHNPEISIEDKNFLKQYFNIRSKLGENYNFFLSESRIWSDLEQFEKIRFHT